MKAVGAADTDIQTNDLYLDIESQLRAGKSNDEIVSTLNLRTEDAIKLVQYFRDQFDGDDWKPSIKG